MSDIVERLRDYASEDHERGCQGREYTCSCGYDDKRDPLLEEAADEITRLRAENERLRVENIQMQAALGYGILAEDERHIIPSNPYKCGTCDASRHVRAEVERLRAALEEAIEFVDQAEMALTPRGEAYVSRWRAALTQPAPSPWRPIETAPKDGTAVLMVFVFEDEDTIYDVVHWDGVKSWPWQTDYTGYGVRNAKGWMPLPPAPKEDGT